MPPRTRRIRDAVIVWGGVTLLILAGFAVSGFVPMIWPGLAR